MLRISPNGLIGKAAGLNITVPNGVEGSSSRIVIRGNNSLLGNNQPLIVVDGVMVDNEPILPAGQSITQQNLLGQNTDVSQNQSTDYGSFLNTSTPTISRASDILKGPTAAALVRRPRRQRGHPDHNQKRQQAKRPGHRLQFCRPLESTLSLHKTPA